MARHTTGFGTRLTMTTTTPAVAVTFEELSVTYPGIQGGEKIDQSSNANTAYRSFEPGDLKEVTNVSASVYYSTDDWDDIVSIINVKGTLDIAFKNGDSIEDTSAWLVSATPTGGTEGERPTMDIEIAFGGEDAAGTPSQSVTLAT